MAVAQKISTLPGKVPSGLGGDVGPGASPNRKEKQDETLVLTTLKKLVAAGEHRLDPMLAAIADAALQLTGASGVALAMWKEGAMVCRARSGVTAPALGARLNADTGISGECLRTGKSQHCSDTENNPLVDVEVCRALCLRSIAVLPVQGWRGVNGILEAFSTVPAAFTEHHLEVLEQLAALAERARASQPHGASAVMAKLPLEQQEPTGLLPASDRFGDVALALVGRRPLLLGALGLAALLLLGFAIWLGWRGHDDNDAKARGSALPSVAAANTRPVGLGTDGSSLHVADTVLAEQRHPPDKDLVMMPNPGGQLLSLSGKPSPGRPVASKTDAIEGKKAGVNRSLLTADAAGVALPQRAPGSDTRADNNSSGATHGEEAIPAEPPSIAAEESNTSALNGVLSAKAVLPGLSARQSQGVSGGQLLHRESPVYPPLAKVQRIEGKVILIATVMEDGSVGKIKVDKGDPALVPAAVEAVKHWRYRPTLLDGKPVPTEITIPIDFKLPSSAR